MAKKKAKKKAAGETQKVKTSGKQDEYAKLQARTKDRRTGGGRWKIPEGRSTVRFIPFETDDGLEVFVPDWRHWGIEPGNSRSSLACPGKKECPLCQMWDKLPTKTAQRVKVQRKYLANLVVRGTGGEKDFATYASFAQTIVFPIEAMFSTGKFRYWDGKKKEWATREVDIIDNMLRTDARGRDVVIIRKEGTITSYDVIPCKKPRSVGITVKPVNLYTFVQEVDLEKLEQVADLLQER